MYIFNFGICQSSESSGESIIRIETNESSIWDKIKETIFTPDYFNIERYKKYIYEYHGARIDIGCEFNNLKCDKNDYCNIKIKINGDCYRKAKRKKR